MGPNGAAHARVAITFRRSNEIFFSPTEAIISKRSLNCFLLFLFDIIAFGILLTRYFVRSESS